MDKQYKTLGEFIIENQDVFKYSSDGLSRLLIGLRGAAKVVNHEVNKAGLIAIFWANQERLISS